MWSQLREDLRLLLLLFAVALGFLWGAVNFPQKAGRTVEQMRNEGVFSPQGER